MIRVKIILLMDTVVFSIKTKGKRDTLWRNIPNSFRKYPYRYDLMLEMSDVYNKDIDIAVLTTDGDHVDSAKFKLISLERRDGVMYILAEFSFHEGSFHFYWRDFRICIYCDGSLIYRSSPFTVYSKKPVRTSE